MTPRVGRPPLPEGQRRDELFGVRMRAEEVALVEKAARLDGRLVSAWARDVLVEMARVVIAEKT